MTVLAKANSNLPETDIRVYKDMRILRWIDDPVRITDMVIPNRDLSVQSDVGIVWEGWKSV
jgi:hypothetical protein